MIDPQRERERERGAWARGRPHLALRIELQPRYQWEKILSTNEFYVVECRLILRLPFPPFYQSSFTRHASVPQAIPRRCAVSRMNKSRSLWTTPPPFDTQTRLLVPLKDGGEGGGGDLGLFGKEEREKKKKKALHIPRLRPWNLGANTSSLIDSLAHGILMGRPTLTSAQPLSRDLATTMWNPRNGGEGAAAATPSWTLPKRPAERTCARLFCVCVCVCVYLWMGGDDPHFWRHDESLMKWTDFHLALESMSASREPAHDRRGIESSFPEAMCEINFPLRLREETLQILWVFGDQEEDIVGRTRTTSELAACWAAAGGGEEEKEAPNGVWWLGRYICVHFGGKRCSRKEDLRDRWDPCG